MSIASEDRGHAAPQGHQRGVKRMLDEIGAERETLERYRRTAPLSSSDSTTQARIGQLQYAAGKMAECARSANFLQRQLSGNAEVTAQTGVIRHAAESGTKALNIVMAAWARGPELGHDFVVRAASKAMAKDLDDFHSVTGFSAALAEELDKRESALASKLAMAPPGQQPQQRFNAQLQCSNCAGLGHVAPACSSKGGGMYGVKTRPPKRPGGGGAAAAPQAGAAEG